MPLGRTVRVAPITGDEAQTTMAKIASANRELGLKPLTLSGTMWVLITNSWMGLGDRVPTEETQSSLKDNFVNVGVVGALLLTLVSLSSDDVGESLTEYGVSIETAQNIFVLLSSLSLWSLFICVLHCLITYCAISELNCVDELVVWLKVVGGKIHMHYYFFIAGFILYIVSQLWLAFTVMPLAYFITSLLSILLAFPLPLFATIRSTQALYKAKIELGERYKVASANTDKQEF